MKGQESRPYEMVGGALKCARVQQAHLATRPTKLELIGSARAERCETDADSCVYY
jgi:hypothetical protein